jgi:Kef-type K+ transport system membrane component KefB
MDQVWFVAALWLLPALVAVLAANWLRISTALSEIVVGTVAQLVIGALVGGSALRAKAEWITFLAGTGAIVLTFLAGAELDPDVFRAKWKESSAVGLVGFLAPFLGAALVAHYVLDWSWRPAWMGLLCVAGSVLLGYAAVWLGATLAARR